MSDPIGDMLTRIRNGYQAGSRQVSIPYSREKESLAKIMIQEGYLKKGSVGKDKKTLLITLSYQNKIPALSTIKRISKPGRRVYVGVKKIKRLTSGLGIVILSTPGGLMSGREALRKNISGEAICHLW
jgi:small subunit ribosomal protein S8